MKQKVPVTIYIDEDEELEAIRTKPLGGKLADTLGPAGVAAKGSNTATMKATFKSGETDAEADVSIDF
ncbi:hypothetical protein ACTZWW_20920 [Salinarimonas sp. NSM]|uniref:hypothetical protein n=1 Tax=Salinarimonas sp. NSM TaxID=3458003 RepID=UPI0040361251